MKPKKILMIAIALLLASLALNLYLYTLTRNYYFQLNSLRLDPLGLVYENRQKASTQTDHPLIVFFGDSHAFLWTPPEADEFEFINLGMGSQTSEQVIYRYNLQIPTLNPDILLVQVGINDLKTIPLFPARKERIIVTVQSREKSSEKKDGWGMASPTHPFFRGILQIYLNGYRII